MLNRGKHGAPLTWRSDLKLDCYTLCPWKDGMMSPLLHVGSRVRRRDAGTCSALPHHPPGIKLHPAVHDTHARLHTTNLDAHLINNRNVASALKAQYNDRKHQLASSCQHGSATVESLLSSLIHSSIPAHSPLIVICKQANKDGLSRK